MADEQPKRRRTAKAATTAAKPKAAAAKKAPARKAAEPKAVTPAPAPAATPKPAAKTRTPAKPRAAVAKKPAAPKAAKPAAPRKAAAKVPDTAKAAAAAATAAVERAVSAVKKAAPEVTPRAGLFAALGTAAIAAGAFFVWRASRADEPRYQTIESDGPIEVRKYPALVTAGTEHRGQRQAALEEGFRVLADYIFAKSRAGARLPMTAPVLSDTEGDGSWRTRFLMPTGKARGELPSAPAGVELIAEPARRVAAIRFSGRADDAELNAKEGALRSWLKLRGLPNEGKAVHAFYNAPFLPGRMRRNEVMIVLSDEGGTGAA
ncbi:MAG: heme-binding protein [Proteobacteria bacterium]|nr:heme-binding protein [Pseudomonadota bacterium]